MSGAAVGDLELHRVAAFVYQVDRMIVDAGMLMYHQSKGKTLV